MTLVTIEEIFALNWQTKYFTAKKILYLVFFLLWQPIIKTLGKREKHIKIYKYSKQWKKQCNK